MERSQHRASRTAAAPVAGAERVEEMDVLRGVALFGVFLMNMTAFANEGVMATTAQLAALGTAEVDAVVYFVITWLVGDKANTLFAFLFGLGFYIQMERAEARGAAFERLYLRRLAILLAIGLLHAVFLWVWDILHLYALAGFLLFALRKASTRALLVTGLLLGILGTAMQEWLFAGAGIDLLQGAAPYSDQAVLMRQAAGAAGDYPALIGLFWDYNLADWLLSGLVLGWILYALGRFLLGAWVGRNGWIRNAKDHLPAFRRLMWIALPTGLVLAGVARLMDDEILLPALLPWPHWAAAGELLRPGAALLLAAGYLSAIIVVFHTSPGRRLLGPFRHAGRMALTNYVAQSFVYGFVLFGVGPGLALAGEIGTTAVLGIVVVTYAAQMAASRWWLARYRFGPLEWMWRGLTYGAWPPLRRESGAPALAQS